MKDAHAAVTFEDFRRWALDRSLQAARRWEEPHEDEFQVLLGLDDYRAFHVVPVPPIYLKKDRGHVYWLGGALPAWSRIAAFNGLPSVRPRGPAVIRNMRTGPLTTQNEPNGSSFR